MSHSTCSKGEMLYFGSLRTLEPNLFKLSFINEAVWDNGPLLSFWPHLQNSLTLFMEQNDSVDETWQKYGKRCSGKVGLIPIWFSNWFYAFLLKLLSFLGNTSPKITFQIFPQRIGKSLSSLLYLGNHSISVLAWCSSWLVVTPGGSWKKSAISSSSHSAGIRRLYLRIVWQPRENISGEVSITSYPGNSLSNDSRIVFLRTYLRYQILRAYPRPPALEILEVGRAWQAAS